MLLQHQGKAHLSRRKREIQTPNAGLDRRRAKHSGRTAHLEDVRGTCGQIQAQF